MAAFGQAGTAAPMALFCRITDLAETGHTSVVSKVPLPILREWQAGIPTGYWSGRAQTAGTAMSPRLPMIDQEVCTAICVCCTNAHLIGMKTHLFTGSL